MRIASLLLSLSTVLVLGTPQMLRAQEETPDAAVEEVATEEVATEEASAEEATTEEENADTAAKDKDKPLDLTPTLKADGSKVNWKAARAVQRSAAEGIIKQMKGKFDPARMRKVIANPRQRLSITRYLMAEFDSRVTTAKMEETKQRDQKLLQEATYALERAKSQMKGLKGEAKAKQAAAVKQAERDVEYAQRQLELPWTLAEYAGTKGGRQMLARVSGDLEWMENICLSGECHAPARILGFIEEIAKNHPDAFKNKMVRDIITATAIEYVRYGWYLGKAAARADYFIRNWKANRLNVIFDTIPFWQRRIVCGAKSTFWQGNDSAAEVASMEWALDNIHLPNERYTGCCWRCGYKLWNLYGESIHGSGYREPFEENYWNNHHQFTLEVGGVCGGLSHFGAYAAVANGIPAQTMGEPGHCAYTVLVNGEWVTAYSVFWQHSLHPPLPVDNMYRIFTALAMSNELYAEENKEDTYSSHAYRVLAMYAASTKRHKAAEECFQWSMSAQPLNFPIWREYTNYLRETKPGDLKRWIAVQDKLCYHMASRYPEIAGIFLRTYVYPDLLQAKPTRKQLLACYHAFWDSVRDRGPERWDVEGLANMQIAMLGGSTKVPEGENPPPPDKKDLLSVYSILMSNITSKAWYTPIVTAWANAHADACGGSVAKDMLAVSEVFSNTGLNSMEGKDRTVINRQMILSAEKAKDIASFQRVGKRAAEDVTAPQMPEFEGFDGELLSAGGLIYGSTTCGHDDPNEHWGLLQKCGGRIHTDKEENPWVAVMLPRDCFVSGVVVVTTSGNMHRMKDMEIQVSDTGNDNSWRTVGNVNGEPQRVNRIEMQETKARYIRVRRKGGPEFFHLNGIYVYGRKAA